MAAPAALNQDIDGQPCFGDPKIKTTFFVEGCPSLIEGEPSPRQESGSRTDA
jgi:hypothetical protein